MGEIKEYRSYLEEENPGSGAKIVLIFHLSISGFTLSNMNAPLALDQHT